MNLERATDAFQAWRLTHPLPGTAALIWLRLAWLARQEKSARIEISNRRLAAMEDISEDSVRRAQERLQAAGWLTVTTTARRAGAVYEITVPAELRAEVDANLDAGLDAGLDANLDAELAAELAAKVDAGGTDAASRAKTPSSSDGDSVIFDNNNNQPTETECTEMGVRGKDRDQAEQRAAWFAQFWAAYPRKVAKVPAQKAFERLRPTEAVFAAMMAGLERDRGSPQWTRDGGNYVPYPATWINQRRWIRGDEAQAPAQRNMEGGPEGRLGPSASEGSPGRTQHDPNVSGWADNAWGW